MTSFKEKLIITAKEIYEEFPTTTTKDKLNNFLDSIKILDSLLIRDPIGLRSVEHYQINGKYAALITDSTVIVLNNYYNEITNIDAIQTKYNTIKIYIQTECQIS